MNLVAPAWREVAEAPGGVQKLFNEFQSKVQDAWPSAEFDVDKRAGKAIAVTVDDCPFTIDICAALTTDNDDVVLFSDRDADEEWQKSLTRKLNRLIAERNQGTGEVFVHRVRVLKTLKHMSRRGRRAREDCRRVQLLRPAHREPPPHPPHRRPSRRGHRAALQLCEAALATRDASTDLGWNLVTSRAAHLAGIQQRLGVSYHDQVDEDGNLIAKRRHHPETPRRTRPLRFARNPDRAKPTDPGNGVSIIAAARHLHTTPAQITALARAGKLAATTAAATTWLDLDALDAYQAEKDAKAATSSTARVPLTKATKRGLTKQARHPRPGKANTTTPPSC